MNNCVREEVYNDLAKFTTHFKDNIYQDITNLPDSIKVWAIFILSIKFNMVNEVLLFVAFWFFAVTESKDKKKVREKIQNVDNDMENVETQTVEQGQENVENHNIVNGISYLSPFE